MSYEFFRVPSFERAGSQGAEGRQTTGAAETSAGTIVAPAHKGRKKIRMTYDYAILKDLALSMGKRVTDLIALSRNRDPFYVGTPAHIKNGKWFAQLWARFGYVDGGIFGGYIIGS